MRRHSLESAARRGAESAIAAMLLALAGCAGDEGLSDLAFAEPETAIVYEPEIAGAPTKEIGSLLEQSLSIYRLQEKGAQSVAFLRRRGRGDVATAGKILRSYGYYEAEFDFKVIEPPQTGAKTPAPIARLTVTPGRQFTLAEHRLSLTGTGAEPPPALDPAALGSPVGGAAVAAGILGAENAALAKLKREGRPYASFSGRDAVADMAAAEIEIDSTIAAGGAYGFGPVRFSGAPNVEDAYLLTYLPWTEGETFSTDKLAAYQKELAQTGLFAGVSVQPPETPPEGAAAPVEVTLEEAPFRSAGIGLRYSTDEGPQVRATFEHRNLFGANEQLRVEGEAGLDEQVIGFGYLEPQYLRPGQDLTVGLELRRINDDKFDELGVTATLGLQRELSELWTVGAGGLVEFSQIDDEGTESEAILFGLPFFAQYDSSDDDLDPTRGARLRLEATPFAGQFDDSFAGFLVLEARGALYQDLLGDKRFVLAERGRLGTILADSLGDVPPTRRFYSGGGGSVRGFAQDLIGPLDAANDPVGGRSVAELGVELRARIYGDIGGVIFADAGVVSENTTLDFSQDVLVAAGLGLRYYSPVGPIRIDVGFPLNGRGVDDSFQVYFSIGQAF